MSGDGPPEAIVKPSAAPVPKGMPEKNATRVKSMLGKRTVKQSIRHEGSVTGVGMARLPIRVARTSIVSRRMQTLATSWTAVIGFDANNSVIVLGVTGADGE